MPDNPDRQKKIPHHPFDDLTLLAVFFPKNREIRLHQVQKFRHHGSYPPEVARSPIPTSASGTVLLLYPGGGILGIEPQRTE
jgi:hypothetical protein